ncbi:MAG: septal ring lytic transglycosylase RlpA family protein [Rhodospirillales bacterium]|nr:septal ring lytic transglycosylase RlpA family protein [Rhodospirillales bacterium]
MSIRGSALRALFLAGTATAALGLGACSELKFGVSVVKSMQGAPETPAAPARAQGTYKVGEPYQIAGVWYYPAEDWTYSETGIASFYGGERTGTNFHGRNTANGELYDMNALTAAHTTLPMPSLVRVTNLDNGRSIVLRVNDRGPFARGRIIDVSRRAAQLLGFEGQGTARVRVDIMAEDSQRLKAELTGRDETQTVAAAPRTSVVSDALPPPPGARETRATSAALPPPSATLPPVATDRSRVGTTTRQGRPRETQVPLARQAEPIRTQAAQDLPPVAPTPAPAASVPARGTPTATSRGTAAATPARPQAPAAPVATPASREVAALPVEQQASARPVLTQGTAQRTNLWVQAGAFGNYENAYRLSVRLSRYGTSRVVPVTLNGSQLYRVRVGPIADVGDADRMLEQMVADVPEARIVVD